MSGLSFIGLGVYLIGDGVRGVPNGGIVGSVAMIVGGIIVIVGLYV